MKLYYYTSPHIIGEVLMLVSLMLFFIFPTPDRFIGLLPLGGGIGLHVYKYQKIRFNYYVLTNGVMTYGEIVNIQHTELTHNDRPVMEYRIRFIAGDRPFHHEFQSANQKHLQMGSKVKICYLPNDPTLAFSPSLYRI